MPNFYDYEHDATQRLLLLPLSWPITGSELVQLVPSPNSAPFMPFVSNPSSTVTPLQMAEGSLLSSPKRRA